MFGDGCAGGRGLPIPLASADRARPARPSPHSDRAACIGCRPLSTGTRSSSPIPQPACIVNESGVPALMRAGSIVVPAAPTAIAASPTTVFACTPSVSTAPMPVAPLPLARTGPITAARCGDPRGRAVRGSRSKTRLTPTYERPALRAEDGGPARMSWPLGLKNSLPWWHGVHAHQALGPHHILDEESARPDSRGDRAGPLRLHRRHLPAHAVAAPGDGWRCGCTSPTRGSITRRSTSRMRCGRSSGSTASSGMSGTFGNNATCSPSGCGTPRERVRGCRRKASSTPRLLTAQPIGLKSRSSSTKRSSRRGLSTPPRSG